MLPSVSIIIPVYNVLPFLRRCLDSVISQTLRSLEIIIVDDGSTDGSSSVIDDYAILDPRVRVIHKQNGGLMSAWTAGVKESTGEYIGFVDSDDYALPIMFEALYSRAKKYDVDLVISNYLVNGTNKGSHPITEGLYTGKELLTTVQEHVFPSPVTYSISMSRMPKLYKRHIILDNLKYTSSLSRTFEDRYIVPAAILRARSVYYSEEAYYCWMLRKGSNHGMYKEHLLDDIKRVYGVQYQVIKELKPSLQLQWEIGYLDFIRLYIDRNLLRVKSFKVKKTSVQVLFKDELTQQRLNQYGYLMTSKLGKAVMISYRLRSPFLLALFSYYSSGQD